MTARQEQKKLDSRMAELIERGILLEDRGVEKLHQQLSEEFPGIKLDKRYFKRKIEHIIWAHLPGVDKALQEIVRWNMDVEEHFCPVYRYIPLDIVKKRAGWHRGITTKKLSEKTEGATLPGIGRIGLDLDDEELKRFRMPFHSFGNPLRIEVQDSENWSLMFLNGSNIGTRHGSDIVGNISRRALSDAQKREDVAVIATNIIALDMKKTAGPPKVGRSLVFGDNVNPRLIKDPEYRFMVEKIIKDHPVDEVIYRTPEELVDDILGGWIKISIKPDNKPEYKGPVYVILGHNENDLIQAAAYWELRWWTLKTQDMLKAKLRLVRKAKKEAEKKQDIERYKELEEIENSFQSRLNRTKMSSIATQEWHRFYERARAVVVKKIEKAIPNAKVIGQDVAFIEIGGKKLEVHVPPHNKMTDRLLANYANSYGPKNLKESLADIAVICHAWAPQFRMTVREADYDGKRGSSKMFVAPIAVDDAYLKNVLEASTVKDHPLAKAVFSESFKSGVLRLHSVNGVTDADVVPTQALESFKRRSSGRKLTYKGGPAYIWAMFGSDAHWGGRSKEFITSRETGMRLGMTEAVFQMMRRDSLLKKGKMRVHLFASPDDATQGHHFKARTQPHPHQLSPHAIEAEAAKLRLKSQKARTKKEIREILDQIDRLYSFQIEKRGSDYPLEQIIQMMERNIEMNADAYRAILDRFKRAQLIVRGVGEFVNPEGGGFDTRNCGIIVFGSGNHFERTVEGELAEGPLYAKHLRELLAQFPEWRFKKEILEKLVSAPLYGGEGIGWSTLRVPGGYEYGFEFRSTPTRMSGWGDPLLGATRNMVQRGNYSRIFNNRLFLSVCGDKHFFGAVATDFAFYHMCGAGTHTDRYGERGFPPNNTGVSFIGMPAGGPDSGPLLVRILPYDVIRDFVQDNPRSFDWEAFLPNPV